MYDIYAYDMEFEQCEANKEHINIIIPYAVIHYIISGEGYVNGEKIEKGSMFIASKDSYMEYYPDKANPWSYVYVRFTGEGLKKAFYDNGISDGTKVMPFNKQDEVLNILSLYNTLEAAENTDAGKIIANALLMLQEQPKIEKSTSGAQVNNVERIKKYIDNNYFKKITVSEISKELYLSSNYIRNLFMKYLGISPKQYIQEKRMMRAKELLLETDMAINLIAHSVGYDDALLFSKMFSKYFSLSPKKFRLKNR